MQFFFSSHVHASYAEDFPTVSRLLFLRREHTKFFPPRARESLLPAASPFGSLSRDPGELVGPKIYSTVHGLASPVFFFSPGWIPRSSPRLFFEHRLASSFNPIRQRGFFLPLFFSVTAHCAFLFWPFDALIPLPWCRRSLL